MLPDVTGCKGHAGNGSPAWERAECQLGGGQHRHCPGIAVVELLCSLPLPKPTQHISISSEDLFSSERAGLQRGGTSGHAFPFPGPTRGLEINTRLIHSSLFLTIGGRNLFLEPGPEPAGKRGEQEDTQGKTRGRGSWGPLVYPSASKKNFKDSHPDGASGLHPSHETPQSIKCRSPHVSGRGRG